MHEFKDGLSESLLFTALVSSHLLSLDIMGKDLLYLKFIFNRKVVMENDDVPNEDSHSPLGSFSRLSFLYKKDNMVFIFTFRMKRRTL